MKDDRTEQLLEKYRSRGRQRRCDLLLEHSIALEVIQDCRNSNIVILGIDFWFERDGYPVQTFGSADYSSIHLQPDAVLRSTNAAEKLIKDGLIDGAKWASFVLWDPIACEED